MCVSFLQKSSGHTRALLQVGLSPCGLPVLSFSFGNHTGLAMGWKYLEEDSEQKSDG